MLHCFQCGKDLPDNLAFCLYCGTKLEDEAATVVHPKPVPEPMPYEPKRSGLTTIILGGLLGAIAAILVIAIIAVVFYTMRDDGGKITNAATPSPSPAASPSPTRSPTPRKPTPSPTPSDSNDDNGVSKAPERECSIVNPQGGSVNLRRNCDTRDCSMDATTLYKQGDPGETVVPTSRSTVTTGKYTWVQVRYRGELVWISSNRMSCE